MPRREQSSRPMSAPCAKPPHDASEPGDMPPSVGGSHLQLQEPGPLRGEQRHRLFAPTVLQALGREHDGQAVLSRRVPDHPPGPRSAPTAPGTAPWTPPPSCPPPNREHNRCPQTAHRRCVLDHVQRPTGADPQPLPSRAVASSRSSQWLSPGRQPGQPMNPVSLQVHLGVLRGAAGPPRSASSSSRHRDPHVLAIPGTGDPEHPAANVAAGRCRCPETTSRCWTRCTGTA